MRRLIATMVLVCSCGGGVFGSNVDGTVDADIPELKAKWMMTPTDCYSGERSSFFGVDISQNDDQDTLLRVVSDPIDGYSVGTNIPGTGQSVFVTVADKCKTFDVDVQRTNTRVNEIYNVEGHALVDCELNGLTLHVDVNFSGCH